MDSKEEIELPDRIRRRLAGIWPAVLAVRIMSSQPAKASACEALPSQLALDGLAAAFDDLAHDVGRDDVYATRAL